MVVRSEMPEAGAGRTSSPAPSTGAPADKTSGKAFRQFLQARQAQNPRSKAVNAPPQKLVKPTPERMDKADHPLRTAAGFYRVPAPIERLRTRGLLDPTPRVNEGMYTAAIMLQESYYNSGLSAHIKSQDLTGAGGGQSTAASYMPVNEFVAHHRQKYLTACKRMGWYEAYPLRGCGRLVVDVICLERSIEDAGRTHFPGTRNSSALAAANDRLREGLFTLAIHFRLI